MFAPLTDFPASGLGAFCAGAVRCGRVQGFASPLRALAPVLASGPVRSPPRPFRWGVGLGLSLLSLWPRFLARLSAAPCGGGGVAPFVRGRLLWGCVVAAFSVVSSRSLVVSRGSLVAPLSAPWWRSLVGSALSSGACRWRVRRSVRSFSGAVVVVGFSSASAASVFAGAWSGWVGFPCAVRRFAGAAGPVFGVSVPVAVPPSLRLSPPVSLPAVSSWIGV